MVKPLLALTLAACSSKSVVGFISAGSHSQRSLVVQDVLASNDDGKDSKRPLPPSLVPNPKQEAVLKAMGFMFDHKKRRWVRGIVHPGVSVVSCSERRLEVLDVDADDASEKPRSAVVDAASYLQEEIRTARENVVGSGQKQTSIPQKLAARRDGLYLWAGLQTLAFMLAAHVMVSDGTSVGHDPLPALILGFTAGLSAAFYDRKKWALQPGLEPSEGALERQLVDSALECHALPAPWDWRATSPLWKVGAVFLEGLNAATNCALVHGVLQAHVLAPWAKQVIKGRQYLDPLLSDPAWFGPPFETTHAVGQALHGLSETSSNLGLSGGNAPVAVLAVSMLALLAAVAELAQSTSPEVEVANAEVAAAARVRTIAHAHFERKRRLKRSLHQPPEATVSHSSLSNGRESEAAQATEAAEAACAMASAWESKFALPSNRLAWELPFLAALSTAFAGAAFELSNGDLFAPLACAVVVLVDRYALRPGMSDHGRVTVEIPAISSTESESLDATCTADSTSI